MTCELCTRACPQLVISFLNEGAHHLCTKGPQKPPVVSDLDQRITPAAWCMRRKESSPEALRHARAHACREMEAGRHQQCRGWVGFNVRLAHRITAGADLLLMPSRFEPCGLNQLYAMAYGTVPIVHAVRSCSL